MRCFGCFLLSPSGDHLLKAVLDKLTRFLKSLIRLSVMEDLGRLLPSPVTVAAMHVMLASLMRVVVHPNGGRVAGQVKVTKHD